jgi:hypothetical protein
MDRKKLDKISRALAQLRRSPQNARSMENLAKRLGRKRVKRGKEPVWESQVFAQLYPLAIPKHGGRDLAPGTKNNILDQLESDVFAWECKIDDEVQDSEEGNLSEKQGNNGDGNGTC